MTNINCVLRADFASIEYVIALAEQWKKQEDSLLAEVYPAFFTKLFVGADPFGRIFVIQEGATGIIYTPSGASQSTFHAIYADGSTKRFPAIENADEMLESISKL